jgi:cupin 2 domain-containing protein
MLSSASPTVNVLEPLPVASAGEVTAVLLAAPGVRLERIVSLGQVTPPGQWYDQADAEWVLLLAGRARLQIEGESEARALGPGDAVLLPAHCRHRVEWTDPAQPTVWLALFFKP